MGGTPGLILPTRARPSSYSSFDAHTRRVPKSREPGTDIFVPIGTEIIAPGRGRIYGSGSSIGPDTGRWVGIRLDDGRAFRTMHHEQNVRTSGVVEQGETYAISGASGYGHEDWSHLPGMPDSHFHATLWPTWDIRYGYDSSGNPYSIDLMKNLVAGAGGNVTPITERDDEIMKLIGNATDGYKFVDEFGADNWAGFAFVQGGYTFGDNLTAAKLLAEQVDYAGPSLELVRHMANARWGQKRGEIVTDVVNALKPAFAEIAAAVAGISPERFAALIADGLAGVVIPPAEISDADKAEIARLTVDLEAQRLAD